MVLYRMIFHGEEDFNFCWRMKKNHIKGKCINQTLVYHKVSATSSKMDYNQEKWQVIMRIELLI